jgi:hypothetical protein
MTYDVVRVDVLDHDALGRQFRCERVGPSMEVGLAARVDGEHGSGRSAGEGAHVEDQALLTGKIVSVIE